MNVLQKALNRDKHGGSSPLPGRASDKKLVSGCYGIDNLFTDKTKKMSLSEFWSGLKDIFLYGLILIPQILSGIFSIIKRPGCALVILGTILITTGVILTRPSSNNKTQENIPAGYHAPFINTPVNNPSHASEPDTQAPKTATSSTKTSVSSVSSVERPMMMNRNIQGKKMRFSRAFESKVHAFFAQHKVSDIMCKDGYCLLKIDNDVFCERSALCEYPKIVLEVSTDDELVFSDGNGNYCTIKIDALLQ